MLVVPIGLQHLFSALSLQRKSLVIFYPKWQPRALEKLLASLSQFSPHTVEEVFVVKSFGGDETESYLIDVLRVSQVPHIAVYAGLNLVAGGSNWTDVIQHLYLPWSLRQQSWRQYSPGIDYISTVLSQAPPTSLPTIESRNGCIQLFISGDRSSVGKSTVCLLLLASLVRQGVAPGSLAYIKPVTQCEATQPVTHYCHQLGIATVEVSPVIFYQGFTRTFLAGETETAEEMLQRIGGVVQDLSVGKRLVIVDGVGYPSVGSICSLSNADVARSLEAPVMLVGKPGVGDAVDSFNLLSAFFEYNRVHVLGAIFNKLETQGFYALEHCRTAINQYFTQQKPHQMPFGYLPKTTELRGLDQLISTDKSSGQVHIDFGLLDEWTLLFLNHVDLHRLILETWKAHVSRFTTFQLCPYLTYLSLLDYSWCIPVPRLYHSHLVVGGIKSH